MTTATKPAKKTAKPIQSRNWCFTDFELLDWEKVYNEYKDIIRYIRIGKEHCPSTRKTHYQGWIQFYNKKRMGGVKRISGSFKLHVESCKGTPTQNDAYCAKEEIFLQKGSFIKQGARTDIEGCMKMIDEGAKELLLFKSFPTVMVRYGRGMHRYQSLLLQEETKGFRKVSVNIFHGKTGSGKTKKACQIFGKNYFKIQGSQLKWFDFYSGETNLIIDEYNNNIPIDELLAILDGYQLRLSVKGGFTFAKWKNVIITTNLLPGQLHENAKDAHREALWRRIKKFHKF